MKKIILLIAVLAALIGTYFYAQHDRTAKLRGAPVRQMLLPDFDVNSVQKIRLKDEKSEVNVALNGTLWTLAERGGYEASFEKISPVIRLSLRSASIRCASGCLITDLPLTPERSYSSCTVQPFASAYSRARRS